MTLLLMAIYFLTVDVEFEPTMVEMGSQLGVFLIVLYQWESQTPGGQTILLPFDALQVFEKMSKLTPQQGEALSEILIRVVKATQAFSFFWVRFEDASFWSHL